MKETLTVPLYTLLSVTSSPSAGSCENSTCGVHSATSAGILRSLHDSQLQGQGQLRDGKQASKQTNKLKVTRYTHTHARTHYARTHARMHMHTNTHTHTHTPVLVSLLSLLLKKCSCARRGSGSEDPRRVCRLSHSVLHVQGGRSLLHLCVLHWRTDVMRYLLSLPYLHYNAQDNVCNSFLPSFGGLFPPFLLACVTPFCFFVVFLLLPSLFRSDLPSFLPSFLPSLLQLPAF